VTANFPDQIVIATRESALALWQARAIQAQLGALYQGLRVTILGMTTQGDRILDVTLSRIGGKGLFVKELEEALSAGRADIAVHSMKDVPMQLPSGFAIAAIGEREDPRDAFVSNHYGGLDELPAGSCVGTSSLRRESQIRGGFPALRVAPLRGNVQTRLRKLDAGDYAAIVLAAAGLKRLGLDARIKAHIDPAVSLPAVGQGALGIECREERDDLLRLLAPLNHGPTATCVRAERSLSRALAGSCQVPLGAFAEIKNGEMLLRAFVATPDGTRVVRGELAGGPGDPEAVGLELARRLQQDGATEILAALEAAGKD
jgi:hydroxymethylbilane synthase